MSRTVLQALEKVAPEEDFNESAVYKDILWLT